ncbi:hypothetical protein [Trichormus variabilis]|uniref:Uncharacterized protein n=1 Tax=Trichormus variabilis SAG 1403-4b TaxID=447716 RepID=A0A433UIW2_ANAVA|nr:hypothetical protein [Trichormus variabilis]MBD2628828.1 hypothetical protein [Trichormus variabilis FACHB-164]RUS93765.1 hypothetical protein DSM107003_42660 [Trichormus variabilis SAG 1403-4b]
MTTDKTTPQSIMLFNEEYILIRKRRFLAGNIAMASMAKYISAIENRSLAYVVKKFAQNGVDAAETMPQELVDMQIQTVMNSQKTA